MKRRDVLRKSTAIGFMTALPGSALAALSACAGRAEDAPGNRPRSTAIPLEPPARGSIPVAFLISEGAVVIDFCGPWEVFQDVSIPGRNDDAFRLYTVSETTKPVRASAGLTIVPDYSFETAPAPKVIVIPAQGGHSRAAVEWIRKAARGADVTMSVCTGAFLLAKTGLLSGKTATTHHSGYRGLAVQFPDIRVKRGARFVEQGSLATAGGLSSGIDLALRVVERYFGRDVAKNTAYQMEYQGQGWMDAESNQVYAEVPKSTEKGPLCPVCEMTVDPALAPKSVFKGKTYYFCSADHKELFDRTPDKLANADPWLPGFLRIPGILPSTIRRSPGSRWT